MDPLRDEALIYEYHLREECGIPTKLTMYEGLPHAAPDCMPMLSQAKKSVQDVRTGYEWLLSQNSVSRL